MAESSVDSARSNLLEVVASTSNASESHRIDSFEESEADEEENSESESQWDELSSENEDDSQETDLCIVFESLKSRDEISNILSDPIPSATKIVQDAGKIGRALYQDFLAIQPHHQRPASPSNLIHLVSDISQQIEDYHPGSDVGPALHAARQVAYWSSVFISMMANSQQPSVPLSTMTFVPSCTSFTPSAINCSVPSTHALLSNQPTVSISTTSPIPAPVEQLPSVPTSALVPGLTNTSSTPSTSSISSAINCPVLSTHALASNQPTISISTASPIPAPVGQLLSVPTSGLVPGLIYTSSTPSTSFAPSAINCPIPSARTLASNQPTVSISTTSPIPAPVGQFQSVPTFACVPGLATPSTSFAPSVINCPLPSTHALTSNQTTASISTTSPIPASVITYPSHLSNPASSFVPGLATPSTSFPPSVIRCPLPSTHALTSNQPTASISTTSPIPALVRQLQSNSTSSFVPGLATPSTSFVPSAINCPIPATHALASIPTTSPIPASVGQLQSVRASFVSPADKQPRVSIATADPSTLAMFREYGSASLVEWLDSLSIPRNIERLQQVRDLWEVGTINCPPLYKWTVAMRNHRSKSGKNSSLFSQRKYIYNLFKKYNFDENLVFRQYNEVRPGKLYKILNSKPK